MMNHSSQYRNLKIAILKEANDSFSLANIIEHFASSINSKRALGRVKSLSCVVCLLEERDLLNSRNVRCFQQLGEFLKNNKIIELVHSYKKLYLYDPEDLCICGLQTNNEPEILPVVQHQENQNISQNINLELPDTDLAQAFQNISKKIGRAWCYLARELGLREQIIDRIRAQYPKNYEQQALEALLCWRKKEKQNATIDRLDKALDSRHCKRKGMCSSLRKSGG